MVLNVNTNLAVEKPANVYTSPNNGIVNDGELTKVAKEILTAAPSRTNSAQGLFTKSNNTNNLDVKLFAAGYDVNVVKQAATNRTGFDVNLSQNALNAINTLKAQAAQYNVTQMTKAVDGKIHVNTEKPDASELKSNLTFGNNNEVEVFESASANKDRRGPGGFFLPFQENEEDEEGLNLVI